MKHTINKGARVMERKDANPADKKAAGGENISDIAAKVNGLANAWDEFKKVNDKAEKEAKATGSVDPLVKEQLDKISGFMDEQKARLEGMEKALERPLASKDAGDDKDLGTKDSEAMSQYKSGFVGFLRGSVSAEAIAALQEKAFDPKVMGLKALSVGSDPDGGYVVSPAMSSTINKVIYESSPMRELASVESITTESMDILDDLDQAAANWTGETSSVSETTTPKIGKRNIVAHEMYAEPRATQKILEDAGINIEAWLGAKVADVMARKEATAFISGNGVGQPRGILSYAAGTAWGQIEQIASGTNSVPDADKLIDMTYSLKDAYAQRATFLMNRLTVALVRKLKDGTGQYLWQPGLAAGMPDILLGRPVKYAADMPVAGVNSLSIALGDFKTGYQIVDRLGITVLRDVYTAKPYVKFYTRKRVGGDVINFESIKLMKFGA